MGPRFLLVRAQRGEFLQRLTAAQIVPARREAPRGFGEGGVAHCRRPLFTRLSQICEGPGTVEVHAVLYNEIMLLRWRLP